MVKGAKLLVVLGIILIIIGFATAKPTPVYVEYKIDCPPYFSEQSPPHYNGVLESINVFTYDLDEIVIGAGLALTLFGLAFTPIKRKAIIMALLLVAVLVSYWVLSTCTFRIENVVGVVM